MKLSTQNQIQSDFNTIRCRDQKTDPCTNSSQPTTLNVKIIGITGKINLSCLLGKKECEAKNTITGKSINNVFRQFLKKPYNRRKLIGGIKAPSTNKE